MGVHRDHFAEEERKESYDSGIGFLAVPVSVVSNQATIQKQRGIKILS